MKSESEPCSYWDAQDRLCTLIGCCDHGEGCWYEQCPTFWEEQTTKERARGDALAAELAEVRERLRLAEEDAVGLDHAVVSVLRGRAGSYTMLSVAHAAHEERLHPAAEPKEVTP